jgi:uncharacterized membrane-anchored protein
MIKLSPVSWVAVSAVALLQTAALAYMVFDRMSLLAHGREIVADVIPVDPRDLFRGDYVILGYSFGRGEVPVPAGTIQGDKVYVTLKPAGPGQWEPVSAQSSYPSETPGADNVVLKGFVNYVSQPGPNEPPKASVRYGIESYFVPEGTGLELEKKVQEKKIQAVLAVGSTGAVAIKALVVDGERIHQEPLL